MDEWQRTKPPVYLTIRPHEINGGCPFCYEHPTHNEQAPCSVIIELTNSCSLKCPVCFSNSGPSDQADPSIETISMWFKRIRDVAGLCNIKLSGGEPTLRDDLPSIIETGRNTGFSFIQLSTNGLRLASDREYAFVLKKAGLSSVFLQFDGYDDWVHWYLRGKPITEEKLRAVAHCGEADLGVILVPTLVRGINDKSIGSTIRLALQLGPVIKGVHFQPISCFGRYPAAYEKRGRITLPEVMRSLEEQTKHLIRADQLFPPACNHSFCSFQGSFVRMPGGVLRSVTGIETGTIANVSQQLSSHVPAKGSSMQPNGNGKASKTGLSHTNGSSLQDAMNPDLSELYSNGFTVSCMTYQDAWNIDLQGLSGCCVAVVAPDGRLMPFCAYNLSSATGKPLYRDTTWC